MSEEDWTALPAPIRRRFSKRLSGGNTAIYVGEVLETWMSLPGWCLVQLARLIGAPLPTDRRKHSPSVVTVTEDIASGGQIWTRLYVRNGFPQVIHSAKRFAGVTGLEEYVGYGISMALTVHVKDEALIFRSAGYFLQRTRTPHSAAALGHARCALGHSRRTGRRPLQLHAADRASAVRPAASPDGHFS